MPTSGIVRGENWITSRRLHNMRCFLSELVWLGAWFGIITSATGVTPILLKAQVQDLVVPFYTRDESEAIAVAQVERIFNDRQRRGFLKINVLHLTVIEGVVLHIRREDRAQESLAAAASWFVSKSAAQAHELRRVTIFFENPQGTNRLSAARAKIQPGGTWQLQQASLHLAGQLPLELASSTLFIHGPNTGTLAYNAAGTATASPLWNRSTLRNPQRQPNP